ncbi:MAG: VTT domain-containing protein [Deltaproteobacteria bacterium]|nr:VTT domain-containing protein [Deltaproteobacteria bacterium]
MHDEPSAEPSREEPTDQPTDQPSAPRPGVNWWRIAALTVFTVGIGLYGHYTGIVDDFDVERIRSTVRDAGALGILAFFAVFSIGELFHIPGVVFLVAGLLSWGQTLGFPIVFVGSVISVSISFFVVRAIGGKALAALDRPLILRILARLDDRPIRTVFILRMFLFLAPPLNYALAMTNVRFRHYLVGSALGLIPGVLAVTIFFDWVITFID